MARNDLTAQRLRELVHYDPRTGIFVRKTGRNAGKIIGTPERKWLQMNLDRQPYRAHRLAWLYVFGEWPNIIDHINGDRHDNRIDNLRSVDKRINAQNIRSASRNNRSGFLGVSRIGLKWRASIYTNGVSLRLGPFETPEIAYAAYLSAKRKLHAGCTI